MNNLHFISYNKNFQDFLFENNLFNIDFDYKAYLMNNLNKVNYKPPYKDLIDNKKDIDFLYYLFVKENYNYNSIIRIIA
tara:strand:- start:122 stop:358 length:237 start_codon:yes stop_codon:yes gene_type:complete